MRIKSELLWGEGIRDKSKIYDLLQAGKLPSGYYLLLCTEEGQMEFIPAKMQTNRYHVSRESVVFGIARSKTEAQDMICSIISDIYVNHVYASVEEFAGEVLGEPIC